MTSVVYVTQHNINPQIANYVDALYFTITTLTTTGFGDITLKSPGGRLLAVIIMVVGVGLFLRLLQAIFRPNKVRFECPSCALLRARHRRRPLQALRHRPADPERGDLSEGGVTGIRGLSRHHSPGLDQEVVGPDVGQGMRQQVVFHPYPVAAAKVEDGVVAAGRCHDGSD